MLRRRRQRLSIALVVIACLLFQQVALAAYACTKPSVPPAPVTMIEDCADMALEAVQEAPALCAKHCAPDHAVVIDPAAPPVPSLALPPLQFALVTVPAITHVALIADVPVDRSDPPPRLRYCSLLI